MKIEIIFEFPTIENPRIDITHDFYGSIGLNPPLSPLPLPPGGALAGDAGNLK